MSFEIVTVIVVAVIFGALTVIANRAEKVVAEKYRQGRMGQNNAGSVQATSKK